MFWPTTPKIVFCCVCCFSSGCSFATRDERPSLCKEGCQLNCRVQSGRPCIMHRHAFNTCIQLQVDSQLQVDHHQISWSCNALRQEQKRRQLSSLCVSSNPVQLQFSSFRSSIQMSGSLCHLSPRALSFIWWGEIQFQGGSLTFNWDWAQPRSLVTGHFRQFFGHSTRKWAGTESHFTFPYSHAKPKICKNIRLS